MPEAGIRSTAFRTRVVPLGMTNFAGQQTMILSYVKKIKQIHRNYPFSIPHKIQIVLCDDNFLKCIPAIMSACLCCFRKYIQKKQAAGHE